MDCVHVVVETTYSMTEAGPQVMLLRYRTDLRYPTLQ